MLGKGWSWGCSRLCEHGDHLREKRKPDWHAKSNTHTHNNSMIKCHPTPTRPVASKSEVVVGKGCECVWKWVWQCTKPLVFFFALVYTTTFTDPTFWKHVSFDWWAIVQYAYGKLQLQAKTWPPEAGKSKVVRLGNRRDKELFLLFLFSSYLLYACKHFLGLTFWKLWNHTYACESSYRNTYKVRAWVLCINH